MLPPSRALLRHEEEVGLRQRSIERPPRQVEHVIDDEPVLAERRDDRLERRAAREEGEERHLGVDRERVADDAGCACEHVELGSLDVELEQVGRLEPELLSQVVERDGPHRAGNAVDVWSLGLAQQRAPDQVLVDVEGALACSGPCCGLDDVGSAERRRPGCAGRA